MNTSCQLEPNKVSRFREEFSFLSNFYDSPISYQGKQYKTVEHAYQAAKAVFEEEREMIRSLPHPAQAKKMARQIRIRDDWDEIRVEVMTELVWLKFTHNPELAEMLLATEDVYLEEGNEWRDVFWGVYNGYGQNLLGHILMTIREQLKNE